MLTADAFGLVAIRHGRAIEIARIAPADRVRALAATGVSTGVAEVFVCSGARRDAVLALARQVNLVA